MRKILQNIICLIFVLFFYVPLSAATLLDVPFISQYPELSTGCEATALTMFLNYYDVDISKEDVAHAMPKTPLPVLKNGRMYGGHPSDAFVGNPFSPNGFGVYSEVIVEMVNEYLPNQALDLKGSTFPELLQIIDSGRPVIIWTTMNMENIRLTRKWYTPNNGLFRWKAPQHAVVLTGYDDEYVYINDPKLGKDVKVKKDVANNRFVSMGRMAVSIVPQTAVRCSL